MGYSPFGCATDSSCADPCDDSLPTGPAGDSAYQVAVKFGGFTGTVTEWLASLIGPGGEDAYHIALDNGFVGTQAEWLSSLVGESAYQFALDNGFVGTEVEWLASLIGKSAYQIAVDNGFVGTEVEWLASLQGAEGPTSITGYRIGGFAASNILAEEILLDHEVTQNFQIPANFIGSKASVGGNPSADWQAIIYHNDVQIGTLTIDTAGFVTWATTGGLPIDVVAGDWITIIAPTSADGSIARLRYTIEGIVG